MRAKISLQLALHVIVNCNLVTLNLTPQDDFLNLSYDSDSDSLKDDYSQKDFTVH